MMPAPKLRITYCRQCCWLLRAAWLVQELPTPFSEELIVPDDDLGHSDRPVGGGPAYGGWRRSGANGVTMEGEVPGKAAMRWLRGWRPPPH